jgi:diguanylate cyclase (GGDEF)-like protein
VEKPYHRQDGTVLWTNLTVSLLRDADGEPCYQLALLEDITERRLLHLRLRYEATHDELTGLPNRTLFAERLERVLGSDPRAERFGLCYLDIDGFKAVNDSLGHAVGDQLLVAVAERLQSCATSPDHLVARIGGDEFAALITNPAGREEVTELARQALAALATPITVDGRELSVRASIGVVEGRSGELGPAEVMRSADITMYRAKDAGGNRYELADPDSDARAIDRHSLTNHLPGALERGEFFLEYQPLVRMADGGLVGAEALVRWNHPVHGRLGPDRFIQLAEHTGLIVPLGRWVLKEASKQVRAWQLEMGDDRPFRLSVNLSVREFAQPDLARQVATSLEESGLAPQALQLEITESAIIDQAHPALATIQELKDLGVAIHLDDFGTGYSALSYLHRLPLDAVKVDRAFTTAIDSEERPLHVVRSIISLVHAIGMEVVAEGVSSPEQLSLLRTMGCDYGQGFFFSMPREPGEIGEMLRARKRW